MNQVITRYPPSPTGELHIGNIRTMLFNYLFARQNNGEIVLRFEDTNEEKSDVKYEKIAMDILSVLGLTYDKGPYRQSERTDVYSRYIQDLIARDLAYEGEESQDGSGDHVIRFRNPNTVVTFTDIIRGEISIDTTDFGDFVIARSLDSPLYHLTVVVDDMEMGITHIIRGEDHITSTPRQILLIDALGGIVPQYAHLPLIVGDDKKKLGKRHGATSWGALEAQGYLPEAFINHLALLGWNPGNDREIFSLEELVEHFDLHKVGKNPARYDYAKLDDINRQYLLRLDPDYVASEIINFLPTDIRRQFESDIKKGEQIMELVILERINKFGDVTAMADTGEFDLFFNRPAINSTSISFKDTPCDETMEIVQGISDRLEKLDDLQWNKDSIKDALWDWASDVGRGKVLHPLRTVLSGREQSPDPFTLAFILGKTETLERLASVS